MGVVMGKKATRKELQVRLADVVMPIRMFRPGVARKVIGIDGGGELLMLGKPASYSWKGIVYD
jgi:hypothetical protein